MTKKENIAPIQMETPQPLSPVTDLSINKQKFSTIRQGNATNTLTKLRAIEGENTTIDAITGAATIWSGNFQLTIPQYDKTTGIKTSTYQLLDAITIAFTESGGKSPTVKIPLADYMSRRGLKNRKDAKKRVKSDMDILRIASITYEENQRKNTASYSFVNIADSGKVMPNGDIEFTFGNTFYNILLGYPVMPYANSLLQINSREHPSSYYFFRKILEQKNMNVAKGNENLVSVKTLLASAPYMPTYDTVMKGNRNTGVIIERFERDMNALSEDITWEYCHRKGEPLSDEETNNFNYGIFENLLVKIIWKNYPDQTARIEKKTERIEAQKKKACKKSKSE